MKIRLKQNVYHSGVFYRTGETVEVAPQDEAAMSNFGEVIETSPKEAPAKPVEEKAVKTEKKPATKKGKK